MQRDHGALFQKLLNWRIVVTWGYMGSGIDPPCVDDVDGWLRKKIACVMVNWDYLVFAVPKM